jgi:hypothetical protein
MIGISTEAMGLSWSVSTENLQPSEYQHKAQILSGYIRVHKLIVIPLLKKFPVVKSLFSRLYNGNIC